MVLLIALLYKIGKITNTLSKIHISISQLFSKSGTLLKIFHWTRRNSTCILYHTFPIKSVSWWITIIQCCLHDNGKTTMKTKWQMNTDNDTWIWKWTILPSHGISSRIDINPSRARISPNPWFKVTDLKAC